MKITKLGHCCLVLEHDGVKIMTDPGVFTVDAHSKINGLDYVFITHEHQDHLHADSLVEILKLNPEVKIVTNSSVQKILTEKGVISEVFENGERNLGENNFNVFAKTCDHADIWDTVKPVQNTGYMFWNKVFYPGDAFLEIDRPVEILALPISAPWLKLSESLRYALKVNPKVAFPVHDGFLDKTAFNPFHLFPRKVLQGKGIEFKIIKDGESLEL